ncbi:MAG: hypothetical protein JNN05_05560 [Candidatus Omnitrophica bacterium]|nr:hypothetical protein [Candidatus Omnitrophota bacterium]
MKVTECFLAGCLLSCGLAASFGFAQETPYFLSDLNGLRDPFASQVPAPKVEPPRVVQKTPPVVSNVEVKPIKSVQPVQDPAVIAGNAALTSQTNAQAAVGSLVVKGMVWNTASPQAIINNQILKVGDEVQGMQILSIESTGIELSTKTVDANGVTQKGANVKIGMSDKRK